MKTTDLSTYIRSAPQRSYNPLKRALWFYVNALIFKSYLFPFNTLKIFLLRLFGAHIGKGVIVKPYVNIKHPWLLSIGDHSWIGEQVWIDNLVRVSIGQHVCLSQAALLLTGSHNYKSPDFRLLTGAIILEDGVWIGAKSTVCAGLTLASHAVLTAGSVATKNLDPYTIYQGNPAVSVRPRLII